MPIYEYRCAACGHTLEALQRMSDGPLRKCPDCGKSQLRRLISAPVFRLKGSGWYETDFKSDSEKKRNLVESGGGESSGDTGAGDKDSKEGSKKEVAAEAPAKADKPAKVSVPAKGIKPAKTAAAKPKAAKPAATPSKKVAAKPRAARSTRS